VQGALGGFQPVVIYIVVIDHMPARADNNPNALEITKRWLRPLHEFGR